MDALEDFCRFAARENIRLRWRSTLNGEGTRYRVTVNVDVAQHYNQKWRDVFRLDRSLDDALTYMVGKLHPHYAELIERQRRAAA